jgi:hypothetical protein
LSDANRPLDDKKQKTKQKHRIFAVDNFIKKHSYQNKKLIHFIVRLFTILFLFLWITSPSLLSAKSELSGSTDQLDLAKQLHLTDQQKNSLKKLQSEYDTKDSLRIANNQNQKEQIQKDRIRAIQFLLNKEQLEQYAQILAEQEKRQDILRQINAQAESNSEEANNRRGFPEGPMPNFDFQGNPPGGDPGNNRQNGASGNNKQNKGGQPNNFEGPGMGGPMGGAPGEMHGMPPQDRVSMEQTTNGKKKESKNKVHRKEALLLTIRLTNALNLNETQAFRIYQIQLDFVEKCSEKKGDKDAISKLQIKKRKSIRSILNKRQQISYDASLQKKHTKKHAIKGL